MRRGMIQLPEKIWFCYPSFLYFYYRYIWVIVLRWIEDLCFFLDDSIRPLLRRFVKTLYSRKHLHWRKKRNWIILGCSRSNYTFYINADETSRSKMTCSIICFVRMWATMQHSCAIKRKYEAATTVFPTIFFLYLIHKFIYDNMNLRCYQVLFLRFSKDTIFSISTTNCFNAPQLS